MQIVLVTNRGEPVIRAVKTLRRMEIATAVVYAPEDAGADWLAEVDYAYPLAERSLMQGKSAYLDGAQIIEIARAQQCDAVWPAWGFLAEDVAFAEAVIAAGLIWIGPPPAAMRVLGSKADSGALARQAGVPTIPEVVVRDALANDDKRSTNDAVLKAVESVGFPLLLKPALGGGGQGQAVVRAPEELAEAWAAVQRVNVSQFQGGPILAQRYIEHARHIEAQVLADRHGTIVVFHERECSIQRRNQKIVEESPSPALDEVQRTALQDYARKLASAAHYHSAGTLEFLYAHGQLYFLEMNTRLQVEHPITEETTRWVDAGDDNQPHSGAEGGTQQALPVGGATRAPFGRWRRIDLLEEMVRVARDERLRFTQEGIRRIGHAIEARIYAEDPVRDFLPCPGTVTNLRFPVSDRFRVETGLRGPGGSVSPRYDPMLAKMIAWGETRATALTQLRIGLERSTIGGLTTNVTFLHRVMHEPDFVRGDYSTGYVGAHPELRRAAEVDGGVAIAIAALALYERDRARVVQQITSGRVTNVAAVLAAIPENGGAYRCHLAGRAATVRVAAFAPDRYVVSTEDAVLSLTCVRSSAEEIVALFPGGATRAAGLSWHPDAVDVTLDGATYQVGWSLPGSEGRRDPHAAPGGGRLVMVCVVPGQTVAIGDLLYITEAMKMEARIEAAFDGTVAQIHVAPGQAVEAGQCIMEIVPSTIHHPPSTGVEQIWTRDTLHWPLDTSPAAWFFRTASDEVSVPAPEPDGNIQAHSAGEGGATRALPASSEKGNRERDVFAGVHGTPFATSRGGATRAPEITDRRVLRTARTIVHRYFHGYDIPRAVAERAAGYVAACVRQGVEDPVRIGDLLAACGNDYRALKVLFSEAHAHTTIYFVEHVGQKERRLPKATEALLQGLAASAGLPDLRDGRLLRSQILHWLQAARYHLEAGSDFFLLLLERWAKETQCRSPALVQTIRAVVAEDLPQRSGAQRARWRTTLRDLDWEAYYAVELPPVAKEYWDLYEQCLADPLGGIAPSVVARMRQTVATVMHEHFRPATCVPRPAPESDATYDVRRTQDAQEPWSGLSQEAATWCARWFDGFTVVPLPGSRSAQEAGVQLFGARPANAAPGTPCRLIAVACIKAVQPVLVDGTVEALPEVERAAIEAYWAMRAYAALGLRGAANQVLLFLPEAFAVPLPGLSVDVTRRLARRVAGFARHLQILATETILTLGKHRRLIQIWHARDVGILSRPPMTLAERPIEVQLVGEKSLDLRQQRLGKLLNRDRARVLFDEGEYEELFFPEVDVVTQDAGRRTQDESIGLNIYRGRVNGQDTLAYAGDFRHRGGALGEREGKKLAASVVLAYVLQVPLIGIHDGAGANIKGSVASLGWAGAYFGAIAATGGFSSPERFQWWLEQHHERAYFEKVLKHFDSTYAHTHIRTHAQSLIHVHLHLGAAVGMLVYGPSISSCAIMVDHPEVYRLLTGAATVERVTGEQGTNYSLGGAPVHSQVSGEIDLVFPNEEAAIAGARALLALVGDRARIPAPGPVRRRAGLPQPEVPVSAGVIVGREAIEANVDGGEFTEIRAALKQTGGLLTGYARLNGQPVVLAVTATDYGMHHGRAFKKMQLAAAAAHDFGLPLIVVVGANWDRLQPVVRTEAIYQQHEMRKAIREATVPKIGIALGPRSLERSVHEMMDLVWYVERGAESVYEQERARLLTHGVTQHFATAMDWCADILRYLPRPWELPVPEFRCSEVPMFDAVNLGTSEPRNLGTKQRWRILPTTDPLDRAIPELAGILPKNINQPYDMRAVIQRVFDAGSWREFAPGDQQPLHTGIATLGGRVVGVIADAPNIEAGAQTVVSISKFTRFHRFCERFRLPVIELNDSPAFRPGREQEQSGIQGEGGKSIREEVLSTIPKIAVTLRQNYGGRYIHANLVTLGPPRRGLIIEGARLGVMGAEGAVGVLFAKELAALADPKARDRRKAALVADYERTRLNPQQAKDLGYAEAVIPVAQLRRHLARLFA